MFGMEKDASNTYLDGRILNGNGACDLGSATAVYDTVVFDQIPYHAESVVQRAFGLIDYLRD